MALVVVEGCDGSGKTTLIDELRRRAVKYSVVLRASFPRSAVQISSFIDLVKYAKAEIPLVICDRFHPISEQVYGPVIRRQVVAYHPDEIRPVDLIVHCRPPLGVIQKAVHHNPQMAGVLDQVPALVERYDELMALLNWAVPVLTYDYTEQPVDLVIARIAQL
jgi:tRNA uridine 5-carbamoylmethylation protein Kti12